MEIWNRLLFLRMNAGPNPDPRGFGIALFLANDLIYGIPVLLAGMWLWGTQQKRGLALRACAVTFTGLGLNQLIALAWTHPRPDAMGIGKTWIAHAMDSSFPSDHGTVFACVSVCLLAAGESGLAALAMVSGIGVAWARIYLGVHFPLDMLGAAVVSIVAYAALVLPWNRYGAVVTGVAQTLYRKAFAKAIAHGIVRM
jgi:undecaprenyl-diphosphatase